MLGCVMTIRLTGLLLFLLCAPMAGAQEYQPPRTAEGRPDFQGNWHSAWLTPFERPVEATALELAPAEAEALYKALWGAVDAADPFSPTESIDLNSLAIVGGKARSSLIVDPANGKLPLRQPLRGGAPPEGFDSHEQRPIPERCLVKANWEAPLFVLPAGNIRQIVQTPDHFVILSETYGAHRIVPLNSRTPGGRQAGRGHWEDDTLVVVTSGFAPNDRMRVTLYARFPISPATTITERFTRISDAEVLYAFTVEDAGLYSAPWTAEMPLVRTEDRLLEWACHEGNHTILAVLGQARMQDQRSTPP